jgi:hypothetical protein
LGEKRGDEQKKLRKGQMWRDEKTKRKSERETGAENENEKR